VPTVWTKSSIICYRIPIVKISVRILISRTIFGISTSTTSH
jgi:hypothetical protein